MQIIEDQLSFDDVLLIPQYSEIKSRGDVNTSTRFVEDKEIQIPIVSANMDTITGVNMANVMHDSGAIGILTRHGYMSEEDHIASINKLTFGSFCIGVQERDREFLHALDANSALTFKSVITVDVAHADSKNALDMIKYIKKTYPFLKVIAGNIATAEAARRLANEGVDGIKVGIGPGSMCTTRIVTGCGFPQLSAVANVRAKLNGEEFKHVTIMADGGIRNSGDIIKALAAGADTVMIGSLLSGAVETPGEIYRNQRGHAYKVYRGQASYEAQRDNALDKKEHYAEGVYKEVPYTHRTAADIIDELMRGVRSGMSYCGAGNLASLRKKARFVRVTTATVQENGAHGL